LRVATPLRDPFEPEAPPDVESVPIAHHRHSPTTTPSVLSDATGRHLLPRVVIGVGHSVSQVRWCLVDLAPGTDLDPVKALLSAPRGAVLPCGGERTPLPVLSQQAGEAGGSLILEAQGRVGAALTTTERAGTARRPGSG
jgi:hypothetical protein